MSLLRRIGNGDYRDYSPRGVVSQAVIDLVPDSLVVPPSSLPPCEVPDSVNYSSNFNSFSSDYSSDSTIISSSSHSPCHFSNFSDFHISFSNPRSLSFNTDFNADFIPPNNFRVIFPNDEGSDSSHSSRM